MPVHLPLTCEVSARHWIEAGRISNTLSGSGAFQTAVVLLVPKLQLGKALIREALLRPDRKLSARKRIEGFV